MKLIQQAERLYFTEPYGPAWFRKVCLVDHDGAIIARDLSEDDARWIIASHRAACEKKALLPHDHPGYAPSAYDAAKHTF